MALRRRVSPRLQRVLQLLLQTCTAACLRLQLFSFGPQSALHQVRDEVRSDRLLDYFSSVVCNWWWGLGVFLLARVAAAAIELVRKVDPGCSCVCAGGRSAVLHVREEQRPLLPAGQ